MNAVLRSISKIFILITLIVFSFTDYAFAQQDLITYTYGYYYTSNDLYQLSEKLVERYSDILQMNVIGKSADGKPIYVVRMTDSIKKYKEEDYVDKMHLLVDAGLHSRETYNSFVVLKTIEDYAKDYYNNSTLTVNFGDGSFCLKFYFSFIFFLISDTLDTVKLHNSAISLYEIISILNNFFASSSF